MAKYTQSKVLPFLFLCPQLIITLIFFIWPAVGALIQSFYFSDAFGIQRQFAGLTNFTDLFIDPSFGYAVGVTLIITVSITVLTMGLGLLLAVLVSNCVKSQRTYKTLLLWPYAVAPAVAAILWRFMCQPGIGWLPINYLIHPAQAMLVVIVAASWQQLSYNFLFFLSGIRAIPIQITEAAILDGASAWRRFWQIIFPLLSPTTFFLLLMNCIYALFDTFGIIDVLTRGGPSQATTTLVYKIYKDGFVGMDPGSSAAQSILLMLAVIGLTLLQFKYIEKKVYYK